MSSDFLHFFSTRSRHEFFPPSSLKFAYFSDSYSPKSSYLGDLYSPKLSYFGEYHSLKYANFRELHSPELTYLGECVILNL